MKKILIIDDDAGICELLARALTFFGHHVEAACDGSQGIEFLKNHGQFEMVITDINMPIMDGNEVARYIKRTFNGNGPQVIAITGCTKDAERGLFDFLLEKPFKIEALQEVVNIV